MTIYRLDVLLSQFGTSLLLHVWFQLLLLDLQTDFSGGRKVVWYSHLLKNIPQFIVIHTVKGFGIVNKTEVHILSVFSYFDDPTDVGNLISGSSAFPMTNLSVQSYLRQVTEHL